MKRTLNVDELQVATFETASEPKVTHEAIYPCTGCMSGCGIQPPA